MSYVIHGRTPSMVNKPVCFSKGSALQAHEVSAATKFATEALAKNWIKRRCAILEHRGQTPDPSSYHIREV